MQKKIIALAIASALVAPAAFADTSNVTVYGIADVSYDSIRTGTSAAAVPVAGVTSNRVSSNASRLGLKGSEDLGNGLAAIWQVETVVNIGGNSVAGAPALGGRNTFAGLSSGTIGTVVLGRHDTPYKISTRKFDVFGDGIADNRSIMGGNPVGTALATSQNVIPFASAGASFDGRQDQVVAYISPKFGDIFTGAIAYVNLAPTANLSTSAKASAISLAGMFDIAGGFYGSVAYEEHDFTAATTALKTKEKATKLGLAYTMDAFNVNLAYEKTSDNLGALTANAFGHTDIYLSGKYMFGNDAVKAAFTKANATATPNSGAKQYSLGYDHSMSKRTTLYALYTKIRNDAGAGYALSNNSSVGGTTTSAGIGASPSAFAIGMKHTF